MFENAAGLGGTGACTSAGWTKATVVAEHVVNESESRPVFSYLCAVGVSDCTSGTAVFERITGFHGDLAIDLDPARAPLAMRVSTGVYLRNQNQKPTAQFTVTPLGTQRVLLNGSASIDPEGRTLRFYWFKGSAPTFTCEVGPPQAATFWVSATLSHSFTESPGTDVPFTLVVCDPGDLQSVQTQTVKVPT